MRRLFYCVPLCLLGWFACATPTRAEAPFRFESTPGKLPKDVVPSRYDIVLAPDLARRTFQGKEDVVLEVRQATGRIVFNGSGLEVTKAVLVADNPVPASADAAPTPVSLDPEQQTGTLTLPQAISPGRYLLHLEFTGRINEDGAGLFASSYTDAEGHPDTMFCTQMEPTDCRRLFPCWDEPAFRASFSMAVLLPAKEIDYTVVSNMPLSRRDLRGDTVEYLFATTPPMASYLNVLAIGHFSMLEGAADGTKIRVITPRDRVQHGQYALESAEKILHYYNDFFGVKFPLPKLDLIAVSGGGSFGGAMENWGGIVFAEAALLYDPATSSQAAQERIFEVIAHEMAHQWFGGLVTMAWWDNLWLNEGFAEWMGEATTDHFNPAWQYWSQIAENKNVAMASDALSTTHPIQQPVVSETDAERAFDEITYNKGQAFIRMLENSLGHDAFRDGLRQYMRTHAYGNATTADLWAALDAATGQPISAIAAGWTEQPGFPLVSVARDPAKPGELRLSQNRFTVDDPNAAPLRWKIPLTEEALAGKDPASSFLLEADTTWPAAAGAGVPIKLNVEGTGYYRVKYDEATLHPLLEQFGLLSAPDQSNLLSDAWAEVRANLIPIGDFFAMVQNLSPSGTSPLVWTQVAGVASSIDDLFVGGDPAARTVWRQAVIAVLDPVFAHGGWQPGENEAAPEKELRSTLIYLLGSFGDARVIAACRERFAAFLKDPAALPPDLRASVCTVVGRYADAATYDELLALARKAASDNQKQLFYYALASAADPALARRTLELAAGSEIQGSFAGRLLGAVATGGEHPAETVDFTLAHLDKLVAKISPMAKSFLVPRLYAAFNDAPRAGELEAYARQPGVGVDPTAVKKSAEAIRVAASQKARLLPAIQAWATGK